MLLGQLTAASIALPVSKLSDKVGRKKPIYIACAVMTSTSATLFSIQVARSATRKLRTLLKVDARLHDRPTLTAFPPSAHSAAVPLSGGCFRFFPPPGGFITQCQTGL